MSSHEQVNINKYVFYKVLAFPLHIPQSIFSPTEKKKIEREPAAGMLTTAASLPPR